MYRQRYPDDPGQHHTPDTFSRTTYRDNPGFCERVRNSLLAIVVGVGLLTTASGLIFWNEGRAVQTAKSLQEGLDLVIPLQTFEVAFQENNRKLVYLSGPLSTSKAIVDPEYGVSVHAVKLNRKVEMYQWVEEEHTKTVNEGDRTREEKTYSYSEHWQSGVINSNQFATTMGHHNPTEMPVKSSLTIADAPSIGSFQLSEGMVAKINNFRQLKVTEIPKSHLDTLLFAGMIYHGKDPQRPQIGDLRVSFEFAGLSSSTSLYLGEADIVSVIGKQEGLQLHKYQTDAGDKLDLLYQGSLSPEKIIGQEQATNNFMCWGIRMGGWLMMFIGFGCITKIFLTLVDWIPILRDVVNLGLMTFNAIMSLSLSLTIIAMGWLWYRPWLGGTLLFLAILPFIITRRRATSATNRQQYYISTQHREW